MYAPGNIPELDQLCMSHGGLAMGIPTDKQPLPVLGRWAFASYRRKVKLYLGNSRGRAALLYSPEPQEDCRGGWISPASQVWYPRTGFSLGLHQCPSFSHKDTKCCLDLSCRFLSYDESISHHGCIYSSMLKQDRRSVSRPNIHASNSDTNV